MTRPVGAWALTWTRRHPVRATALLWVVGGALFLLLPGWVLDLVGLGWAIIGLRLALRMRVRPLTDRERAWGWIAVLVVSLRAFASALAEVNAAAPWGT
jgi:hypothetical protein